MQEQRTRLNTVMRALRHWDPIGVMDILESDGLPPDEYDAYAPGLLAIVQSGADKLEIAMHLVEIRTSQMELGTRLISEREDDLAEKLVDWRNEGYVSEPDFRFLRYV